MSKESAHRGDRVEVKSPAEILATLDEKGMLDGLPFMPEMVAYCGRQFTVAARADKICDTIDYTGSRRLPDAVLLEDQRCDGSGHDGCQAECLLFFKDVWVRKVEPGAPAPAPVSPADAEALRARVTPPVKFEKELEGKPVTRYMCQATELQRASKHLPLWDVRTYVNEYTNGNVSLGRFLKVTTRAAIEEPMRKLNLMPEIHVPGTLPKPEQLPPLNLIPGEWVQVKSKEEIARTLTAKGRNKGMWFDREMLPYCGGTYRVRSRVARIVNDHDGGMLEFKNDCVTLDNVICSGDLSQRRWFCPRAIIPYWRESWLKRADAPKS
jgi:hypothetical protein